MAVQAKISPYRLGEIRFGRRDYQDGWKPELKEYRLTSEELEQYKAGKSIDDILKERDEKQVAPAKQKIELTEEKYNELREQGLSNKKIAEMFGMSEGWIYKQKEKWSSPKEKEDGRPTKEAYEKLLKEKQALQEEVTALKKELQQQNDIVKPQQDLELEKLKKEIEQLHKEIQNKDQYAEQLKEYFETAMSSKEQAQKEVITLENEVNKLKAKLTELEEAKSRINKELFDAEFELKILRRYVYFQLQKEIS
jgi:transposase